MHLHVVLEWRDRTWTHAKRFQLPRSKAKPQHMTTENQECQGKKRVMTSAPLHYYCQVPKNGQVHTWTDKPAFTSSAVNPRWLNMWIQAQKLDPLRTRGEFVKCCVNLTSNLQNVDRLSQEHKHLLLQQFPLQLNVCN